MCLECLDYTEGVVSATAPLIDDGMSVVAKRMDGRLGEGWRRRHLCHWLTPRQGRLEKRPPPGHHGRLSPAPLESAFHHLAQTTVEWKAIHE